MRRILLAGAAVALLLQGALSAHADYEGAKTWFDSLAPTERSLVQDALSWTGDYRGKASGIYNDGTYTALQDFQKRRGAEASGMLSEDDLAALYSEARRIRAVVNYHVAKEAPPRVVYRTKVVYRDAPRTARYTPRARRLADQPIVKRTNIRQYYPAMSQGVIILP